MFHQKAQSRSMQETMATDPSVMVDMMKKNLTGMVPQVWANYGACWALFTCMHADAGKQATLCQRVPCMVP